MKARLAAVILGLFAWASLALPAHANQPAFDYPTWNHWRIKHHYAPLRPTIFGFGWMNHRRMCGGVISSVIVDRGNFADLQSFQGCYAELLPGTTTPTFHRLHWMR